MRPVLPILLFFAFAAVQAQDSFSGSSDADTVAGYEGDAYADDAANTRSDDAVIAKRTFDENAIETLKADPDLNYKEAPTVGESLWERLKKWLLELFFSIFDQVATTSWGRLLIYLIGLAAVVYVVMMLLRVNAFRMLFSKPSATRYQVFEENIHEMDFDALVREALQQQDFRRAIRLRFLHALKLLSDRELIQWQPGKTNHDYATELNDQHLKPGFNALNYYFDYVWYGNFGASRALFDQAQDTFSSWRLKLR